MKASVEFKVKVSLLVKPGDREGAAPQTERPPPPPAPPLVSFASFMEAYLIKAFNIGEEYSESSLERNGEPLEELCQLLCVLMWAFCFP